MEKITEAYLDTSVFVVSALDTGVNGEKSRNIIDAIQKNSFEGYTSALTFDELAFAVRKLRSFENSIIAGDDFLNMGHLNFIEIAYETVKLAQDLIKKYRLRPRDAIHAACAMHKDIKIIVSDDADFDSVKELERKSIKDFKI
ncbi:type II toxin-antitoxin system VapC family toxin [Candidatus Woesearchaeota archaeon]|nr:type II toxin-antitoxin system VapC family toxin [Candidatus Woesearchaeota archaeon]